MKMRANLDDNNARKTSRATRAIKKNVRTLARLLKMLIVMRMNRKWYILLLSMSLFKSYNLALSSIIYYVLISPLFY